MTTHSSGDLDGHRTRCTGDAGAMSRGIFDPAVIFFSQKTRHSVTGRQNKTSQNKTKQRLERQRLARAILPYRAGSTASSRTCSPSTVNPQNLATRRSNQRSHAGASRAAIRTQCPSRHIKAGSIALLRTACREPTPEALMDTPANRFALKAS